MSRNRMKNSQSLHWMGVLKWILIAGPAGRSSACATCSARTRTCTWPSETHRLQKQLEASSARNTALALDLESMKSPTLLERRLAQMHSSLVPLGRPAHDRCAYAHGARTPARAGARWARCRTSPQSQSTAVAAAALAATPADAESD